MNRRFAFILMVMMLAFITLVCVIRYNEHHPMDDAEIQASRGIQP